MNYQKYSKKIAILLATRNGEKYIKEQINSLIKQKISGNISLFISDDGSTDKTILIIKKLVKNTKIKIKKILHVNFKSPFLNFLNLIQNVPSSYDYYFFCDQDDVWLENKLKISTNKIDRGYDLFISDLYRMNNQYLKNYKKSTFIYSNKNLNQPYNNYHKKKFLFFLINNCINGNVMTFSKKLFYNFKKDKIFYNYSHDHLLLLYSFLFDYKILFSKKKLIVHRHHESNFSIKNTFFKRFISIIKKFCNNSIKKNYESIELLRKIIKNKKKINKNNITNFNNFFKHKKFIFDLNSISTFFSLKLHKRSLFDTFLFYILYFLKKI
jgi:glycosyltransferase involved in cell wall biosynthesis